MYLRICIYVYLSIYLQVYNIYIYILYIYYFYHHCHVLLFVDQHNFWLVSHHQFVSLDLEVPQDLGLIILNYPRMCLPF